MHLFLHAYKTLGLSVLVIKVWIENTLTRHKKLTWIKLGWGAPSLISPKAVPSVPSHWRGTQQMLAQATHATERRTTIRNILALD